MARARGVDVPMWARPYVPARARYYCATCGARVFPGDALEGKTEAPEPGKRGGPVLLRTWNSEHPDEPYGYCWGCKQMVRLERRDPKAIIAAYVNRKGVVFRT